MAYFKNYYDSLKKIKDDIYSDVDAVENDDRLIASMLDFAKEISMLMETAANNSAIENKVSQAPKGVSHWWAGGENEPDYTGNHESKP